MSHVYARQLLHIVFSTKERRPHLMPEVRPRMLGYLRTVATDLSTTVLALNGVEDHVHLLVDLPPSLSTSELLDEVEGQLVALVSQGVPED